MRLLSLLIIIGLSRCALSQFNRARCVNPQFSISIDALAKLEDARYVAFLRFSGVNVPIASYATVFNLDKSGITVSSPVHVTELPELTDDAGNEVIPTAAVASIIEGDYYVFYSNATFSYCKVSL